MKIFLAVKFLTQGVSSRYGQEAYFLQTIIRERFSISASWVLAFAFCLCLLTLLFAD
jgi:hypothetical protein